MDELSIIDEQIRRGWGSTPGVEIPANWRDVEGPEEARASLAEECGRSETKAAPATGRIPARSLPEGAFPLAALA